MNIYEALREGLFGIGLGLVVVFSITAILAVLFGGDTGAPPYPGKVPPPPPPPPPPPQPDSAPKR